MIMTNELKDYSNTLHGAANALVEAANQPDEIQVLHGAQEQVTKATDVLGKVSGVLERMVSDATSRREAQVANLTSDQATLCELTHQYEEASLQSNDTNLLAVQKRIVDMLGAKAFPRTLAALCQWLVSEARQYGRHYADFNSVVAELRKESNTHLSDRKRLLPLSYGEIDYLDAFSHTLKNRIIELTQPKARAK